MTKNPKIPEGYRQNANGDLKLIENIKEIDLIRDELVVSIATRAKERSGELAEFRNSVLDEVNAFKKISATRFKANLGGSKGNVTLMSFDGRFKLLVAQQDNISFDERLQIAQALVQKCIDKRRDGADPLLIAMADAAFKPDQKGSVSIRRLQDLRRANVPDDKDWKRAMDAIGESMQVIGSKTYIRIYERDERGEYRPISLDISGV